ARYPLRLAEATRSGPRNPTLFLSSCRPPEQVGLRLSEGRAHTERKKDHRVRAHRTVPCYQRRGARSRRSARALSIAPCGKNTPGLDHGDGRLLRGDTPPERIEPIRQQFST